MAVPSTLPAPGDEMADRRLAIQVAVTRAALRELLRLLHRSGAVDLVRYADGLERLAIEQARIGAEADPPEASRAALADDLTELAHVLRTDAVLIAEEQDRDASTVS
jgi:DNA-binding FadR family transcriptional regulator